MLTRLLKTKKIKNKNSLICNLIKKDGKGIVKSLDYYYSNGITDINKMIKNELENNKQTLKLSRNNNDIIKFKDKKCIIF